MPSRSARGTKEEAAGGTRPLNRQSLADQVAEAILAIILDQHLSAGDALPSTGDLAERFSVSRTVIREALADLAGRGIIERSQGRESVVSNPGPQQLQELLTFQVRRDSIDSAAITEFRHSIEVESARLAAIRADADDLELLNETWERLRDAGTEAEFHEADIAFHRAIAVASRNPLILLVLDALVELLRDVRRRAYRGRKKQGYPLEKVVADHRAVLVAIEKHHPEQAAAAMARHIEMTAEQVKASRTAD